MDKNAALSNDGRYTLFTTKDMQLKIIAPKPLEKYIKVLGWNNGCLTVLTKYSVYDEPCVEYIDIKDALNELGLDSKNYLSQIEKVYVDYE